MIKRIIAIIILFISALPISKSQDYDFIPQTLSDSSQISIMTSAPWPKQVYAVFGHSAMRVYDPVTNIDWVFNYGVFDFNKPNFIYRFMAGETDYMVIAIDYRHYVKEYEARGINVFEQVVRLDKDEKQRIWQFLLKNSRTENRVYRYNIFYNNCTTKLTDILESNINGTIEYKEDYKKQTFRDLIHECVQQQPWLEFGIDLIIGSGADKTITVREKMFLPAYQMNTFDHAIIKNADGTIKPLVQTKKIAIAANQTELDEVDNHNIFSPIIVGFILLILSGIFTVYDYKKKRVASTIYDTILFLTAGIAGSIIFFMMFFSVHPCTNNNWNLIWLNPLQLIFALLFFVKPLTKCVYYYHFINFVVLILLLSAWSLIPQKLEIAFIPYILAIALRSGVNIYRKIKKLKEKAD